MMMKILRWLESWLGEPKGKADEKVIYWVEFSVEHRVVRYFGLQGIEIDVSTARYDFDNEADRDRRVDIIIDYSKEMSPWKILSINKGESPCH